METVRALGAFLAERAEAVLVEVDPAHPVPPHELVDRVAIVDGRAWGRGIPRSALAWLAEVATTAPFVVVAGPNDRRGWGRRRPSDELARALGAGLPDLPFVGTCPADGGRRRLLAITGTHAATPPAAPPGFRAAALVHAYNEAHVLPEVIAHLGRQGLEVHVFDNHSTDGTWPLLQALHASGAVAHVEQVPASGPLVDQDWVAQLRHSEQHALASGASWVMHHDADEIRMSPWRGVRLVDALARIDALGYSAVDFVVADFHHTSDAPEPAPPFEVSMPHFEFGRRPGHFVQVKGWRNAGPVDLASGGGHEVVFPGRKIFPLKLLLKHYSLRGQTHARRKIYRDRYPRGLAEQQALGWHTHYNQYVDRDEVPCWDAKDLLRWDDDEIDRRHLVERLTSIGLGER